MEDLLKYLDSNLLTLNQHLLKSNFDRILQSIWVEVLEEFKEVLVTEESVGTFTYTVESALFVRDQC